MSAAFLPQSGRKCVPVSVVIPCYRSSQVVRRAVESVVRQTCVPLEIILVDDASGDATLSTLHELAETYGRNWIHVEALAHNVGAAGARNAGWALARGTHVAFLDADDTWAPLKLEIQYGYMLANPDVDITGHEHRIDRGGEVDGAGSAERTALNGTRIKKLSILLKNPFVTPSVMIKRDIALRFSPHRRYMEDHLLWLEAVCAGMRVERLDLPLAFIHKAAFGESGLSSHLWAMEKGDLANYRDLQKRGLIGRFAMLALCAYSLLKFARRLLVVSTRQQ